MEHGSKQNNKRSAKALAVLAGMMLATSANVRAATPEPLPPPPELLDGQGYAIDVSTQPPRASYHVANPQNAYNNYGQPKPVLDEYDPYAAPPQLPPLPAPGQQQAQPPRQNFSPVPHNYSPAPFAAPELTAPPMATLPPNPPSPQTPRGAFQMSPPAAFMPDDYFNLPMVGEQQIPGVVLPELDPNFVDPGQAAYAGRRYITPGMSSRQLEPFFELAKGFEKAALDAKQHNDAFLYKENLGKAVGGYMEIIAMADATSEAREEAWYGVARCEYRRENWWKAFDALERSFPEKYDRNEVLGRIKLEMYIGERMWRMGRQSVPDSRKNEALMTGYQAAARVYTAALFNQPNAADAPLAMLRRGDAAAMENDWPEAAKFYRSVVQYYPESEAAMQARSSLTEAVFRQEWQAGMPEEGLQDLDMHMGNVERNKELLSPPAEERRQRAVTLANSQKAEEMLRTAKSYMSQIRVKKSRDAAVFQLGEIVSHYPNTPQAREASELLRGMGIEPPMVLSDGSRYPLTPSSQPEDFPARGSVQIEAAGEKSAGSGQQRRQEDTSRRAERRQDGGKFSPIREPDPVEPYRPVGPDPVDITVPGVSDPWQQQ